MYQPEKVAVCETRLRLVPGGALLKSQGIEFETIDVMEDPAFEHMEKISGQTLRR